MVSQREADFLAGKNYGKKANAVWNRWTNFKSQLNISVPKGLEERYLKTLQSIRKEYQEVLSILNEYDVKSEREELQLLEIQMIEEEQELTDLLAERKKGNRFIPV